MNLLENTDETENGSMHYLAMWDMYGLEYIVNLTAIQKQVIWSVLKEEKPIDFPNLQAMILRARFNTHRNYEIYTFNASSSITEEQIKELFETSPQFIVDFIRKNGFKIYGSSVRQKGAVIN